MYINITAVKSQRSNILSESSSGNASKAQAVIFVHQYGNLSLLSKDELNGIINYLATY